jgi:hypothetical protein
VPRKTRFQYPMEAIEFFQQMGRKGGKVAATRMTAEQRRERARRAAKASAKVRSAKAKAKAKEALPKAEASPTIRRKK